MMEDRSYLLHIRDCLARIREYASEGREAFFADSKTQDAIIRNLEVIGEAAKNLSLTTREAWPDVPWKRIGGMRDLLIHHYFGVKLETVWEVIEQDVPRLQDSVDRMLKAGGSKSAPPSRPVDR